MPELHELTASQMARQIRAREVSAVDVAEALLARTDSLESLQAWVYIDRETVLADAEQRQRELDSLPNPGPLHGVPVGVKDIFYTAGIPTTACSRVYADFVPEFDAAVLSSLKQAGAIMMGKTVTTEFACLDPSPTLNPWNPAHTPGGSSSGSAVSVATGMCPVALGSQTVGSVLRPASYNGVVGLKPTYGRVSRYGVVPVSWSLDTMGWMSRTVEDAALMLQVMAGPDANDPVCARFPAPDYLSGLESGAPPRISLVTSFFMEQSDEETQRHTRAMLEILAAAGAEVDEVTLPDSFSTAIEDQLIIMRCEAASFHQPMYEDPFRGIPASAAPAAGPRARDQRRRVFRCPRAPPAFHHRHAGAGRKRRCAAHADHADSCAGRPHQHRRYRFPGPLDVLRPAHHHPPLRARPGPACPWACRSSPRPSARSACWPPPAGANVS